MKFETLAIRTQINRTKEMEHSTPLFPTSSYVFEDAEQMRAMFSDEIEGNIYSRFSNPNCTEFETKMALLEGYPRAIASATGMSAIFTPIMALLKQGDHIISSKAIFGSSYQLFSNFFPNYGIETSYVQPSAMDTWDDAVRPNTKMLYLETPSNPGLEIIDLEKAAAFAKKHNLIFMVDNCFATPYLQRPIDFGADIVTHSATKFIDGQGRVVGGISLMKEEYYDTIRKFHRNMGPTMSPFNAWILSKSLETLAVRMDKHCDNALKLATYLEKNKELNWVKYPFLPSHPQYEIAKKQMTQGGGIVAFELKGGIARGRSFLNNIQLLSLSANLGDCRTIVTHPASTTHSKIPEADRLSVGITDGMVRLSVGLEHLDDVIADIEQAIEKSK